MTTAAPPSAPVMRTRPLCRDHGGDARSQELAASIEAHQRAIARHEGALLQEIAEFDRVEAWRGDGALSMRAWLVARCRISAARARVLVTVAEDMVELPRLSHALSEGSVTLDVVAPLAAVATRATDAGVAEASAHWTPKQAREWAAGVKGVTGADSAQLFNRRSVRFDDERCTLWAQLTRDSYASVKSALVGRALRHDHPSSGDDDYEPFEARCADALLNICVESGRRGSDIVHGGAQVTMVVHTDLEMLLRDDGYGHASIEGGGPISAEVARRLACDAGVTISFDAPDGTCLDQKPLRRDPTTAQRIEIRRRDNGCRFPGCSCTNVTAVHHVVWASRQGPTVMSNLLTLCVAHHSRVHELGWKVDGDANDLVTFTSPHGRRFVSSPSPNWRRSIPMRT